MDAAGEDGALVDADARARSIGGARMRHTRALVERAAASISRELRFKVFLAAAHMEERAATAARRWRSPNGSSDEVDVAEVRECARRCRACLARAFKDAAPNVRRTRERAAGGNAAGAAGLGLDGMEWNGRKRDVSPHGDDRMPNPNLIHPVPLRRAHAFSLSCDGKSFIRARLPRSACPRLERAQDIARPPRASC